jgi:hypothetical protein
MTPVRRAIEILCREYSPICRLNPWMRTLAITCLLGACVSASAEPLRFSSGPTRVALIELYTSEGCSSCPPADQWLGSLAGKPGLWRDFVPVEFHVNYWDSLGWKDRLSTPAFTAREYAYSSAWGAQSVYTPCFVRNGSEWRPLFGGTNPASESSGALSVEVGDDGNCHVEFLPGPRVPREAYEVHVAILGGGISSKVTAGENGGRMLTHEFVVLGLAKERLSPDAGGAAVRAVVALPKPIVNDSKRRALAAWVVRAGDLTPLQATGGWLP